MESSSANSARNPANRKRISIAWAIFCVLYLAIAVSVICFAHQITGIPAADFPSWLQIGLAILFGGIAWAISTVRTILDFQHNSRICIALKVMVDDGRESNSPGMVLFSLDSLGEDNLQEFGDDANQLLQISHEIFSLYKTEPNYDDDEINEFVRHLNNDTYQDGSRYQVPANIARGRRLCVADILISRSKLHPDPRYSSIAVVAVTGELNGGIIQLPWHDHPSASDVFLQEELEPAT